MDNKEPVRLQLEYGITAQVDWQPAQAKPFWLFGFIWDDCESECYQPCMWGGSDPMQTIYQGIVRYDLPMPAGEAALAAFNAWLKSEGLIYDFVMWDADEPVGDDGYPLDMDDETKAWLSANR